MRAPSEPVRCMPHNRLPKRPCLKPWKSRTYCCRPGLHGLLAHLFGCPSHARCLFTVLSSRSRCAALRITGMPCSDSMCCSAKLANPARNRSLLLYFAFLGCKYSRRSMPKTICLSCCTFMHLNSAEYMKPHAPIIT